MAHFLNPFHFFSLGPVLVTIAIPRIPRQLHSREDFLFLLTWGGVGAPAALYATLLVELLDQRPRESFLRSSRARMAALAALGFLSVPFTSPSSTPRTVSKYLAHNRHSINIC